MSRPTELTDEIFEKLVMYRRNGVPVVNCAGNVGISRRAVYQWLERGRRDVEDGSEDTLYGRFYLAMARARSQAVTLRVGRIAQHGARDWRADAWYLDRTEPAFREKTEVEVHERGGLGIDETTLQGLDDATLAELRRKAEAAAVLEAEIREILERAKGAA